MNILCNNTATTSAHAPSARRCYISPGISLLLLIPSWHVIHYCNNENRYSAFTMIGPELYGLKLHVCADYNDWTCACITFHLPWMRDDDEVVCLFAGRQRQVQPEADRTGEDAARCPSDCPQRGPSNNFSGGLGCHGLWKTPVSHIQG